MSEITFTEKEQLYLDCPTPMVTRAQSARKLTGGLLIGLLQAAFSPGSSRGDQKLISTSRLMRYTKYKQAVLRKRDAAPKKGDEKLLKKLNQKPFALEFEEYDTDAYTQKLYEEYMEKHEKPSPWGEDVIRQDDE